jgi:hypothetical protein
MAEPVLVERDRLVAWALGTFHAAALLVAATLILHLTGGLASTLSGLNTVSGLALFAALWLTTVWSTRRTLRGALDAGLRSSVPIGPLIGRAVWRGGVNGVAFMPLAGVILAFPVVLSDPRTAVPFLLVASLFAATIGLAIAFGIGCIVGLLFAGIDILLLGVARTLLE